MQQQPPYWFYRDAIAACRGTDLRPVLRRGGWLLEPRSAPQSEDKQEQETGG
jgi:hypothetical protein